MVTVPSTLTDCTPHAAQDGSILRLAAMLPTEASACAAGSPTAITAAVAAAAARIRRILDVMVITAPPFRLRDHRPPAPRAGVGTLRVGFPHLRWPERLRFKASTDGLDFWSV